MYMYVPNLFLLLPTPDSEGHVIPGGYHIILTPHVGFFSCHMLYAPHNLHTVVTVVTTISGGKMGHN